MEKWIGRQGLQVRIGGLRIVLGEMGGQGLQVRTGGLSEQALRIRQSLKKERRS